MSRRIDEITMEEYPVIIVGAGPAGSACAKALKNEGINPLIIEKNNLPRHKTCSGILFGQTQALLKEYFAQTVPASVCCRPEIIKASDIQEWINGKGFCTYQWEIPKDGQSFSSEYINVWRDKFDHWLLKQSGAVYRDNCLLYNFSDEGNKVTVEVLYKNESGTHTKHKSQTPNLASCSYLIGADGANSKVRGRLDPLWNKSAPKIIIYQAYFIFLDIGNLKQGQWNVFFEPDIGDILCSAHCKDDLITLCVGGFKGRNLKNSMEKFKTLLSDKFGVVFGQEERWEGCVVRAAEPNLGRGRVILTGEAGGFMYLNGEGISAAIDSGFRCGKAVAYALKENKSAVDIYNNNTTDLLVHMNMCTKQTHFFVSD